MTSERRFLDWLRLNGPLTLVLIGCIALAWFAPRNANTPGGVEIGPEKVRGAYALLGGEAGKPPVVMFVTDWCPVCKALERELAQQGISFVRANVEKDAQAAQLYSALLGGSSPGVPVTLAGKKLILGFQPGAVRAELGLPG